jgi:hypothetical protein
MRALCVPQRWRANLRWALPSRRSRVLGIVLGTAGFPALAHAAPSVSILCEQLSHDDRASVEARARADLAVKGLREGSIELSCADGRARADYAAPGAPHQSRSAPSAADPRQLVEQLLALLDDATTTSLDAPATPREGERPPVVGLELPRVAPSSKPLLENAGADSSAAVAPSGWRRIELGIGIAGELWFAEITAAIGPRFGVGVALYPELYVRLSGAMLLASQRPEGIGSRLYALGAEAEWQLAERMSLVMGANLSQLVIIPQDEWTPTSRSSLLPGLHARLPFRFVSGYVALGPEVVVRSRQRDIQLDERTALEVPAVCAGLLLELRFGVPLE